MAFARLAPHCGLTPVYGHNVGICDMRGGFSWSSIGNSLSSGLRNIGSFLSNTAQKIGNSEGFKQAKQGFLQSGVIENAGNLAGSTLSSLVDIGRLKVEQDLQKLKNQTLGIPNQPVTQEQIAQLIASMNAPSSSQLSSPPPPMTKNVPFENLKTSIPESSLSQLELSKPVTEISKSVTETPFSQPDTGDNIISRTRKRKRVSGWGAFLDDMTGEGVNCSTRKYCY
ncbi:pVI [Odocoileus adenovirus 1]|uniref:PVI n=2 Tax=Deer atadenovirus A TaxID=2169706 RepID=A0A515MG01_9ADEN|nr:pVI [Odocoileus adenovirus 1]QDM55322.1 pVI [Deer atadenovirus A]ASU50476.1 pVI [Odocoileus adenovirus 1]ASU50503.1 pVI [Odocoileus adenovirus 1]ASU50530.1 pVI [Odocoileus adenovirus 1]ASU50557.1 pVI [Odocoileus adenovirus 1]